MRVTKRCIQVCCAGSISLCTELKHAIELTKPEETLDTELKHAIALTKPEEALDTELKHAIALTKPEETLDTELKHGLVLVYSFFSRMLTYADVC
jgi:SpoU rRNA methylase family enzyme